MPMYRVIYEMDINAETPEDAAREADMQMRSPDSTPCFSVFDIENGKAVNERIIDMMDLEGYF